MGCNLKNLVLLPVLSAAIMVSGCALLTSESEMAAVRDRLAELQEKADALESDYAALKTRVTAAAKALTLIEKLTEEALAQLEAKIETKSQEAARALEAVRANTEQLAREVDVKAERLDGMHQDILTQLDAASDRADELLAKIDSVAGVENIAEDIKVFLDNKRIIDDLQAGLVAKHARIRAKFVESEEIRIVDAGGKSRALLGLDSRSMPRLVFLNEKGKAFVTLQSEGSRGAGLVLTDLTEGATRSARLFTGGIRFSLNNTTLASLATISDTWVRLSLFGAGLVQDTRQAQPENPLLILEVKDNQPKLMLCDVAGQLFAEKEKLRTWLGLTSKEGAALILFDKDGNVTWKAP